MTDWKAELDALVQESMVLAKSIRVEPAAPRAIIEPPVPRNIVEPNRLPPVSPPKSERDEIRERVSNFKAHQERFAREREEFAASLLKRISERTPSADRNG
jgi:hypothetical protein